MRGDVTIRWATPDDWPMIWPWVRGANLLPTWITAENPTTLVADRDGGPVAALSLTWGPWGYGSIDWVVTNGQSSGHGAGRRLATAALAILAELGLQGAVSVVSSDLARVLAFDRSFPGASEQQETYRMFIMPLGGSNGKEQQDHC